MRRRRGHWTSRIRTMHSSNPQRSCMLFLSQTGPESGRSIMSTRSPHAQVNSSRSTLHSPRSWRLLSRRPSMPPSTMSTWPETCPETVWEERMTIWFATSSGAATFFSGVLHAQSEPKIPLDQREISAESRGRARHSRCQRLVHDVRVLQGLLRHGGLHPACPGPRGYTSALSTRTARRGRRRTRCHNVHSPFWRDVDDLVLQAKAHAVHHRFASRAASACVFLKHPTRKQTISTQYSPLFVAA